VAVSKLPFASKTSLHVKPFICKGRVVTGQGKIIPGQGKTDVLKESQGKWNN